MNQEEAQALFQKFAAPLAPYVTSAGRKEAAESLARSPGWRWSLARKSRRRCGKDSGTPPVRMTT